MTENQTLKGSVDPLPTITLYASGVPVEIAGRIISKSKNSVNYMLYGYRLVDLITHPVINANKHSKQRLYKNLKEIDPIIRNSRQLYTLCPDFLQLWVNRLQQPKLSTDAYKPAENSCYGNILNPEMSRRVKRKRSEEIWPDVLNSFVGVRKITINGNTYYLDKYEHRQYLKMTAGKPAFTRWVNETLFEVWLIAAQPKYRKVKVNHYNEPVKLATYEDFTNSMYEHKLNTNVPQQTEEDY
ncbi:hypothetical protein IAI01_16590 [Vibrio cholerae]|uniref:hypothetical protein n=1 Tax=Vibrio cholerae TaxID=666 RepID=UPI0000F34ED8|nr:hypothetical protein [Vibrio cholerae]ACQ62802.1 hypothetical protein VCD_000842 [Vibrio cholerae MJ-1236]EAZ78744.1 hypothetical protein A5E_A0484 [Vibrio cholerae B33]EEO18425.1 hypothetical protein VCE_000938 [Vibrio cholerae B33]EMB00654.1 Hypothetical protein B839_38040 [Vibrio cholerae O1 str. Inaba G4222]KAA6186833.1 hypothetical protein F2S06_17750 [Vibrio cholerae O1 biovar El Tor]